MEEITPNFHIIRVTYLGPTNSRGSRMKLTSLRFLDTVILPYNYEYTQGKDQAINFLQINNFDVIGSGYDENRGDTLVICKNFMSLKDIKRKK